MKKIISFLILLVTISVTSCFLPSCSNEDSDPITEGCIKVEIKGIGNGIVYVWALESDYLWRITFYESDLNGLSVKTGDIIEIHIVKYEKDLIQLTDTDKPSITCQKINYCK